MTPVLVLRATKAKDGRLYVDPYEFKRAQQDMMARGKPEDPCGRCGCKRKGHLPGPTFSYAKSGGSSGRSLELTVLAPLSCDCKFCMCSCPGFVEPFIGQRFIECEYERRVYARATEVRVESQVQTESQVRANDARRAVARDGNDPAPQSIPATAVQRKAAKIKRRTRQ